MEENRRQNQRLTGLPAEWKRTSIHSSGGDSVEGEVINLHPSGARVEIPGSTTFLSTLNRGEPVQVRIHGAGINLSAMVIYVERLQEKMACGLYFLKPHEQNTLREALSRIAGSQS